MFLSSGSFFAAEPFIAFRRFTDDLHITFVRIFTELGWKGSGKPELFRKYKEIFLTVYVR